MQHWVPSPKKMIIFLFTLNLHVVTRCSKHIHNSLPFDPAELQSVYNGYFLHNLIFLKFWTRGQSTASKVSHESDTKLCQN